MILNHCKNNVKCSDEEHRFNRRTEFKIIAGPTSIEIEKQVLMGFMNHDNFLMACGGGTPCYKNNMELMNDAGSTVYLDVPHEVLLSRLSNSRVIRPLIQGMTKNELKTYIDEKINERKSCYLKSKIWINPIETSLDTIVTSLRYI